MSAMVSAAVSLNIPLCACMGLAFEIHKLSRLHPQATTPRAADICEKSEVAAIYLQTVEVTQVYERVVGLFSEDSGIPVIPAQHLNSYRGL